MNLHWIRVFLFSLITVLSIVACISPSKVVPEGINIEKNQLIYRDVQMEIWAHDGQGEYHHYVPQDSAEYLTVANHLGTHLESTFLAYCKLHQNPEIVNVNPNAVFIILSPKKVTESRFATDRFKRRNNGANSGTISNGVSIIRSSTGGETHSTIRADQKGDKKN